MNRPAARTLLYAALAAGVILLALARQRTRALFDAAGDNNTNTVARLLAAHPQLIDRQDPEGRTPLGAAADAGSRDVIAQLLAAGADIDARDNSGATPLALAVAACHPGAVTLLIKHGANLNPRDNTGFTPIFTAALQSGAWNHAQSAAPATNTIDLNTAFTLQADRYLDLLEYLLTHGADPNALDTHGRTPLHYCAIEGYQRSAEILLAHGADPNLRDTNGATPLHLAEEKMNLNLADLLRQAGGKE